MPEVTLDLETSMLIRYLDAQRDHAIGILEGLDDEALRQPVLPSGWNCLGLVQHLALEVERFWFGATIAADRAVIDSLANAPNAWQVSPDVPAESIFNQYRQEIARSNEILSATPLDAAPAWWPGDLFGDFRLDTVREIVMHAMTETACHTGHLDVARELTDGRLWLVLDV